MICIASSPASVKEIIMTITRIAGASRGRSRAVVHNGLVHAVATDTTSAAGIAEQTRRTLEALDRTLADAGSDKTRLLQATVYLRDMAGKAEMDAVWCDWIGDAENWPQRACVGADLAGDDLVEIVVTATVA
jgi:enamine deaminase RidA (YjgF/YER057c/UK114 family)